MTLTKVDYTTFTKNDPNSHLGIVGTDHLDFDAYRNEDCYLYKDYGVDYFGDFDNHKVDIWLSRTSDSGSQGTVWMLSDDIDDVKGLKDANKDYIRVYVVYSDKLNQRIWLEECYNGVTYVDDYFTDTFDYNWRYITIEKSGTSLICKIYSDSARTTLLDTLSLTLHTDHKFRNLFACNTYNQGVADVCTLDIENLSIPYVVLPIACDTPTSHFSSGCDLLLHYDVDNDGVINLGELNQSYSDYENGIITEEEFDFVSDAYIYDGINVVCPGCFSYTCDSPTVHYPTGCALVLHYDQNSDGEIGDMDALRAADDLGTGIITTEEMDFIAKAYAANSILDLCPGCYTVVITFVAKKEDNSELTNVKVYINQELKGET